MVHLLTKSVKLALLALLVFFAVPTETNAYTLTKLNPVLETDGTVTDFKNVSSQTFEGFKIFYSSTTIEYGQGNLLGYSNYSPFTLSFIQSHGNDSGFCGAYDSCGATTTGYYLIAYASGGGSGYSPDWTNGQIYYYTVTNLDGIITNPYATSSTPLTCETCTRVITSLPSLFETTIYTSTTTASSIGMTVQYYVAETDFNENDTYLDINYGQYQLGEMVPIRTYTFDTTNHSVTQYANILDPTYESEGTYFFEVVMYSKPWYLFGGKSEFFQIGTTYVVGTTTNPETLLTYKNEEEREHFEGFMNSKGCNSLFDFTPTCLMWAGYFLVVPDASQLGNRITASADLLMSRPPIGYAYVAVKTLYNATTTSTTSLDMVMTIPENLPAGGTILSLPIGTGIQTAINNINDYQISSIDGQPFDKFLTYWNALWYIMFIIWLIGEIFGVFNVDFGHERVTPYHETKRQNNLNRRNNNTTTTRRTTWTKGKGTTETFSRTKHKSNI